MVRSPESATDAGRRSRIRAWRVPFIPGWLQEDAGFSVRNPSQSPKTLHPGETPNPKLKNRSILVPKPFNPTPGKQQISPNCHEFHTLSPRSKDEGEEEAKDSGETKQEEKAGGSIGFHRVPFKGLL